MVPIQNLECVLVFTYTNWTTTAFWNFICCLYFVWYLCFIFLVFCVPRVFYLIICVSAMPSPTGSPTPLAHLLSTWLLLLPLHWFQLLHHFLEQNFFLHVKSETIKFLQVRNIWVFLYRFIYWARLKWQKVDSFFWIYRFSSKLSYHSYQHRVCKFMFLTRTFVKTNSN